MKAAQREAGEALLARLLRLSTALAATADADKAAQMLANRIGEVLVCDRAVLVSMGPPRPSHASNNVKPTQRSVLADAILLAAEEAEAEHGPCRFPALDRVRSRGVSAGNDAGPGTTEPDALARTLDALGGTSVLWWPLPDRDGVEPRHVLWLERHQGRKWQDEELAFAYRFGPLLAALLPAHKGHRPAARRRVLLAAGAALIAIAMLPVPAAVTAPAQVVAADPRHVFSGMDGVIGTLAVQPGQHVAPGDLILRMDTRVLEKNVEEARQAVAVAQAELARVRAASHYDADARARLAVVQVELARARLELDFHTEQLSRAEVRSELAGQVLLEDPDRLPGAAVRMGERLLSIADTRTTRLRIMVPLADFSLVDEGAPVQLTLDRSPLSALAARVVQRGYTVRLSDDQVPSIVVEAEWRDAPPAVFPGARGTARITGDKVPLVQHLLRKPVQALRRAWGV